MKKMFCDICGEEITVYFTWIDMHYSNTSVSIDCNVNYEKNITEKFASFFLTVGDLCPLCKKEIENTMNEYTSKIIEEIRKNRRKSKREVMK